MWVREPDGRGNTGLAAIFNYMGSEKAQRRQLRQVDEWRCDQGVTNGGREEDGGMSGMVVLRTAVGKGAGVRARASSVRERQDLSDGQGVPRKPE